jgi:hypothetical protein
MAKLSGGGITSNKLVKPGVRAGARTTQKVDVGGVSQIGQAMGARRRDNVVTTQSSAKPMFQGNAQAATPLGNELATNVGKGGPGTGRTIYDRGTQAQTGPAAQGVAARPDDIDPKLRSERPIHGPSQFSSRGVGRNAPKGP